MNAAIQGWREELLDRVESERLPLADRAEGADLPGTQVTSLCVEAETPLGNFTSVLFYESDWYENENGAAQRISTLVFDEAGLECNLAAASGVYDCLLYTSGPAQALLPAGYENRLQGVPGTGQRAGHAPHL